MNQNIESGVQLFSRVTQRLDLQGINPKIFNDGGPRSNQIVEIVGDSCNELLLDLIVRCILPSDLNKEWKGLGAIFINTDHHIGIIKITNVINEHLKLLKIKSRRSIIEAALQRLTILNCYDSEQTDTTFRNLERIIRGKDQHSLIVVDNLTSHYWITNKTPALLSMENYTASKFNLMQKSIKDLNLVFVFGRQQITDPKKPLHPNVDYKIIINKNNRHHQLTVINYEQETETAASFALKTVALFN